MSEQSKPNGEERRVQELEAEIARLRKELERANEFKEGYKSLFLETEDRGLVEREMKAMMESPEVCRLADLIREWDAEENTDAA